MQLLPQVDILLSIYKPNLNWLKELLESLNKQTYTNTKVIIWNDCPDDEFDYLQIFDNYLTNIKFDYIKAERNCGATKAFENLIRISKAEYIAFCDQDDIWLSNKIELMMNKILMDKTDLVCCDMCVIDKNGNKIADSITQIRPKQKFYLGENLFQHILINNYVYGCACLIKKDMLKKSLPFPEGYYHDWWCALYISAYGKFSIILQPLIKYRIHGSNQTGFLNGIETKKDYYKNKIYNYNLRMVNAKKIFIEENFKSVLIPFFNYSEARKDYYLNTNYKNLKLLFSMRNMNLRTTIFEIFLPIMPEFLFKYLIKFLKLLKR